MEQMLVNMFVGRPPGMKIRTAPSGSVP